MSFIGDWFNRIFNLEQYDIVEEEEEEIGFFEYVGIWFNSLFDDIEEIEEDIIKTNETSNITGNKEMSIYIYTWSYDNDLHIPVKTEYEIHDFVYNKDFEDLANEPFIKRLASQVMREHERLHPNSDREINITVAPDNIRPSFKPKTKQTKIYAYECETIWKGIKGNKYRKYKKKNEKWMDIDVN